MVDFEKMFHPVIESMGFEFVGVDFSSSEHHGHLRVYIDHKDGITLDHCSEISRQLSALLDVEDPITVAFDLEVSSPGLNRPLFKLADYETYKTRMAKIKLAVPLNNRRNFKGTIDSVKDDLIVLNVDNELFELSFNSIAKANLVHQF